MFPDVPIAILDSGLGGLTVVRYLRAALPHERIVYFGDTARTPYGLKSAATVTTFVRQIVTFLRKHEPKHVVIACNTSTALALPTIRAEFTGLSISGVVEPGARAAIEAAGSKAVPLIGRIMGKQTLLIDSSEKCAEDVARRLAATGLLRGGTPGDGGLSCFLTDDAPRFRTLARRFLGADVDPPTLVTTDELHGGAVA